MLQTRKLWSEAKRIGIRIWPDPIRRTYLAHLLEHKPDASDLILPNLVRPALSLPLWEPFFLLLSCLLISFVLPPGRIYRYIT